MDEYRELCKQVYERLGWELDTDGLYIRDWFWEYRGKTQERPIERYKLLSEQALFPAYDTDYLLGKLPQEINEYIFQLVPGVEDKWQADYREHETDAQYAAAVGPKPIIALLRLTLALADADLLEKEG